MMELSEKGKEMLQKAKGEKPGWQERLEKDPSNNYFVQLAKVKCDVEKKNNLNYVSWSNAWAELKRKYSDSEYEVYTNKDESPLFKIGAGGMVHVSVKVVDVEHEVWMPILDYRNQSKKYENITSFDVNTAIQRALTKGIAMHGLGLYVYMGEDLPKEG